MAFASEVREELCRFSLRRRCCAIAQAYGILLFCHTFSHREVRIVTESPALAEFLPRLFQKAFHVTFDQLPLPQDTKGCFQITDQKKLKAIFQAFDLDWPGSVAMHINLSLLEEDHCRSAFLRGAFLGGGSVTDPMKDYHLELNTSHVYVAREAPALMQEAGFAPRTSTRKSTYIIYFKQSEVIGDFLTYIGAPLAAMGVMTAKMERDLRASVNRQVNCDSANLDKTVEAAREQAEAIRMLQQLGILDSLPDKLRETALFRLDHTEYSLTQMAASMDPPVSKSAMNHRMRKLMRIAGSCKGKQPDSISARTDAQNAPPEAD